MNYSYLQKVRTNARIFSYFFIINFTKGYSSSIYRAASLFHCRYQRFSRTAPDFPIALIFGRTPAPISMNHVLGVRGKRQK
jgi:hypothetical protein